jgi:hypothetical protein
MIDYNSIADPLPILQKLIDSFNFVPGEIISLSFSSTINDRSITRFLTSKYLLKIIVKLLVVLPQTKQSQTIWERFFSIMKDEKRRILFDFFLKRLSKDSRNGIISSAPFELTSYFGVSKIPPVPPTLEDVMIAKFICQSTSFQQYSEIIQWATLSLNIPSNSQNNAQFLHVVRQLFELISFLQSKAIGADFHEFCQFAIDVSIRFKSDELKSNVPLEIVVEAFSYTMLNLFLNIFVNKWSNESFILFCQMLSLPHLVEFRKESFFCLRDSLNDCFLYLNKITKFHLEFVVSQALQVISTNLALFLQDNSDDLYSIQVLAVQFFSFLSQSQNKILLHKPTVYSAMVKFFLPTQYAPLFEIKSPIFTHFENQILPLFSSIFAFFVNHHFPNYFVTFYQIYP